MTSDGMETLEAPRTPSDVARAERVPRLELLYCANLSRIGESTAPDGFATSPGGVIVGRNGPGFGPRAEPIGDAFVSRELATIRWIESAQRFELTPPDPPRATTTWLDPQDGWSQHVLDAPCRVPAGTLVRAGDRLLIGLRADPAHADDADRLGLVGESAALWQLRDRIERAARFRDPVLLLGETGVGKELVANAIHRRSGVSGRFVAVNMGGLDAGTASSELFGHVRGAFTDARSDRTGAFEAAADGTLFLDEIGDLAPDLQKKLLRVLETGTYAPVGATQTRRVTARVVAATHHPLQADVAAGAFRRDLFERLNGIGLPVPALRDRLSDVPRLFVHFLRQKAEEQPGLSWLVAPPGPTEPARLPLAAILELLRRDYPGNVRELKNLTTALAVENLDSAGDVRAFRGLELIRRSLPPAAAPDSPSRPRTPVKIPTAAELEAALREAGGNVRAAAAALGASRHQLYRWINARGLDVAPFRDSDEDV